MKKSKIIYTRRDGDVCVWLSFYRLFLQVGSRYMKNLRISHRGDTGAIVSEALLLMGIKHKWDGDDCILTMEGVRIVMDRNQQAEFIRASQIRLSIPNDHAYRMRALMCLQMAWKDNAYSDETRKWVFDMVMERWRAPKLAMDCLDIMKAGVEPFSLLKWRVFRDEWGILEISVLWCGFWVTMLRRKATIRIKTPEGDYMWNSVQRIGGMPMWVRKIIYRRVMSLCDDGRE